MKVNLEHLEVFVEVARQGSFTEVAKQSGIATTQVWRKVHDLEQELGSEKLFEKTGKRVRLSADGQPVHDAAKSLLEAVAGFKARVEALKDGTAGTLRIGCAPFHMTRYLGRVLADFGKSFPGITIDLSRVRDDRARAGQAILDDLLERRVDVILSHHQEGLESIEVYDMRIVAVLPDHHDLRKKKSVELEDLAEEPLLVAPRGFWSREKLEVCFATLSPRPRIGAELHSAAALLTLGKAGRGIPLLVDAHLPEQPAEPYPVVCGPNGDLVERIAVSWRGREQQTQALTRFLELVRSEHVELDDPPSPTT